jgi:hypothetical protein
MPSEPAMELLEPHVQDGYFYVRTTAGEEGYVWARSVQVWAAPAGSTSASLVAGGPIPLHPGLPGSASMAGCGDGLWQHVYHPTRLVVKNDCVTITGVIVDATAPLKNHQPDGMRHEPDGDTHGWIKLDPPFANLINAGNISAEGGNLVFEIVCHYPVRQADAKPACARFADKTAIPPVGAHVAIRGTVVQEQNHQKWNEIHPVTRITVQP